MAKEKYRSVKFRGDSLTKIEHMVSIVAEYQKQGLRMTARQLYYQFVSRDLISNTPQSYKSLTSLLTDARYAGLVDWDAIEDRGREPSTPAEWDGLPSLVDAALRAYRLPRWSDQPKYVELWVEKQALAGVLAPIAREYHATLMVNKGYSSASAMKESAERIKKNTIKNQRKVDRIIGEVQESIDTNGSDSDAHKTMMQEEIIPELRKLIRTPIVLYLGDHDPSGEDMVRDIATRLKEFGVIWLEVEKVALTMAQVTQYDPPPNPAKITDPRAADYIKKHGEHSWEVDALPPDVLARLIRNSFNRHVDKDKMDEIKKREEIDKARLREVVASISSDEE